MSRTKGSKNKVGSTAKDNIVAVFDLMGGRKQMAKWAASNETEFYRLYSKLIPVEQHVSGSLGTYEAIPVEQRDDLVANPVESTTGAATNGHQATHH